MTACEEIRAFLAMAEEALQDPVTTNAQHIGSLPEQLQCQLAKAINAISHDRYEQDEMRRASQLVSSVREIPGGVGEAIRAMLRVLIDNDAFRVDAK